MIFTGPSAIRSLLPTLFSTVSGNRTGEEEDGPVNNPKAIASPENSSGALDTPPADPAELVFAQDSVHLSPEAVNAFWSEREGRIIGNLTEAAFSASVRTTPTEEILQATPLASHTMEGLSSLFPSDDLAGIVTSGTLSQPFPPLQTSEEPTLVTQAEAPLIVEQTETTTIVTTVEIQTTAAESEEYANPAGQTQDPDLLRQGIDLYMHYLQGELQTRNDNRQSHPAAPVHAGNTFLTALQSSRLADLFRPGLTGGSLQSGQQQELTALLQRLGTGPDSTGTDETLQSLSPEQYKTVLLMAMMFQDPEARERAVESVRNAAAAGEGIRLASSSSTVTTTSATTATSVSANLSVNASINYNAVSEELHNGGSKQYESVMIQLAVSASATTQLCDPLILDLAGDGIHLTGTQDGVLFDIDGDGQQQRTGFIRGDDAFLYLDQDGDGLAGNGRELFGDQEGDADGFAKLEKEDGNNDGEIDAKDAVYERLRLWQDLNGDGVCQQEETGTLADFGVASIALTSRTQPQADGKGNVIAQTGSFTRSDGSQGLAVDALLRCQS